MRLLLLDNFDSFTHTLADYFQQLGAEVVVRRNDVPLSELQLTDWDGIVLSPGPGVPAAAGVMPAVIACYHAQLPMLGVCLGHQALGEFFGAELGRACTTGPGPPELMALRHKTLPLFGVQFHPEALLTPDGLAMLANWLRFCNIVKPGPPAAG